MRAPPPTSDMEYLLGLIAQLLARTSGQIARAGTAPLPSSLVGTQIVDPQNVTGKATASGANTATVAGYDGAGYTGRVWSSYRALTQAWGSWRIVINQSLTIVFASSHTDDSDPVSIEVTTIGSGNWVLMGNTPSVIRTDTLNTVAQRNRAAGANSMLLSKLNAATVSGTRLQNTTRGNSIGWSYNAPNGGQQWPIFQPCAFQSALAALPNPTPTQLTSWVANDTVNEVQATQANIVCAVSIAEDQTGGNGEGMIYGLDVFTPNVFNSLITFAGLLLYEVKLNRETLLFTTYGIGNTLTNCYQNNFVLSHGEAIFISGGCDAVNGGLFLSGEGLGAGYSLFDGDFVLAGAAPFISSNSRVQVGFLCLDSPLLTIDGGTFQLKSQFFGGTTIYAGPANTNAANINVAGMSKLVNSSGGTFASCLTAPAFIATGIQMSGTSTAFSISSGTTLNAGITTTPAHLDAAAGAAGFGGLAFNFQGPVISNVV